MHRPEPDVEHPVEVAGDAGLREDVAHVDEERHGDQRIPVEHLERRVEGHLERALPPQPERRRRPDEADHAEDALPGEEQHHHRREHEEGDELRAHAIGFPRAAATSLMKVAIVWSSIRKMPMVIATFTGHRSGAQEE